MAEKRIDRVAAVQIAPDLSSREGTVERVVNAIAEAAGKGAKLVVFPETFVPWYPYFSFCFPPVATGTEHLRLYENAVAVPSPATQAVAGAARRHAIVVALGVNERDHGTLYNTQLLFDADGSLALKRRKITPHLPRADDLGAGRRLGPDRGGDGRRPRRRARPAGNTTTRSPATPSWRCMRRSMSRSFPARWSARSSPTRSR